MNKFISEHSRSILITLLILYWIFFCGVISLLAKIKGLDDRIKSFAIIVFIIIFLLVTFYLFGYIDNEINNHIMK